jgi:hypothetical protein
MLCRLAIRYAHTHKLWKLEPHDLIMDSDLKLENDMVSLFILKGGQRHRVIQGQLVMGKDEGANIAWGDMVLQWADMYAAKLLKADEEGAEQILVSWLGY